MRAIIRCHCAHRSMECSYFAYVCAIDGTFYVNIQMKRFGVPYSRCTHAHRFFVNCVDSTDTLCKIIILLVDNMSEKSH